MTDLVVLDAKQAADWDSYAQTEFGIPGRVLMETAGRAGAAVIATEFSDVLSAGVVVVTGPGNNGGDGWVVARALAATGVTVSAVSSGEAKTPGCIANKKLALESGVTEFASIGEVGGLGLIVDALLGTGGGGELRGAIKVLTGEMADHGAPVVAIDGPTGVDLSTGAQSGRLVAAVTVTFGGLRRGHLLNRTACGKVVVTDIGFPPPKDEWPRFVSDGWVRGILPVFTTAMHKGDRGRIVVIGGAEGMSGAALHAVHSSFAAGAGLVKLVSTAGTVAAAKAATANAMTLVADFDRSPEDDVLGVLEWADAVVLGPGMGVSQGCARFVDRVLESCKVPLVLDADALKGDLSRIADGGDRIVVTPHPGEFRKMFPDLDIASLGVFEAARMASERLGCTVLLKGVPTVIASADETLVVGSGNPALATGGSGDVLSGLVGAFLARDLSPVRAAALGAQVLGRAAELASAVNTVRATRPEQVVGSFAEYWRELEAVKPNSVPVLFELDAPSLR